MESSVEASRTSGGTKPVLAPKPLLAPKPFSLQKNTSIRSIHAPRTITAPKTAAQQPRGSVSPASPKAPVVKRPPQQAPVKEVTKDPPAKEPDTTGSLAAKPQPAPESALPKPTSEPVHKEGLIKEEQVKVPTSTNKQPDAKTTAETKSGPETSNGKPAEQTRSGDDDPPSSDSAFTWGGSRKRLSTHLTSKFESGGPPPTPEPTKTPSKDAAQTVPVQKKPSETTSETKEIDGDDPKEETEGGGSIKDRISLLFDSSSRPEVLDKRDEPDIVNGGGVKERIKNWTSETNPESPKTEKKPQVISRTPKSVESPTAPTKEVPPIKSEPENEPSAVFEEEKERSQDKAQDATPEESVQKPSQESKNNIPEVRLRSQSPAVEGATVERPLKRDNGKRRSVHFGVVERDDGGPPIILGPASDSSGDEEEAPRNKPTEKVPDSVPTYRRVGILHDNDTGLQNQQDEQLKHLAFEKRRKVEESTQRDEEEEAKGKQSEWEIERVKEEEREQKRLREEEIETERQTELMLQRHREQDEEKAKREVERLRIQKEEERLKEQEKEERHRESRWKPRHEEEERELHQEVAVEGKRQVAEMHEERKREDEWETEWVNRTGKSATDEPRNEELMRERSRQEAEERERKEDERRKEEARMHQQMEEERRRIELQRKMQEEEQARNRMMEMELEREREELKKQRERVIELERQKEERERILIMERQREEQKKEQERKEEFDRQREAQRREQERAREEEIERQREAERRDQERAREEDMERQREAQRRDQERAREEEMERQREAQRRDQERAREEEMERQREAERRERERAREEEMERQREAERREEERAREEEMERQMEAERREQERAREEDMERQMEAERREQERAREEDMERQREAQRREQEREREEEMERQREAQRREQERAREEDMERQSEAQRREQEREREEEMERQREAQRREQDKEMMIAYEQRKKEELERLQAEERKLRDLESQRNQRLIDFDSEEFAPKSPVSPEGRIEVVYDDFSVKKPLIDVDFDDFSVKPIKWGSQTKTETTPVERKPMISWDEGLVKEIPESTIIQPRVIEHEEIKKVIPDSSPVLEDQKLEDEEKEEDDAARPDGENILMKLLQKEAQKEEPRADDRQDDLAPEAEVDRHDVDDKDTDFLMEQEEKSGDDEQTTEVKGPTSAVEELLKELSQKDDPDVYSEPEVDSFPESSSLLLDNSAQRSKLYLSKRRSRKRPSRSLRLVPATSENQDWRACDSTDIFRPRTDSDAEDESSPPKMVATPPSSQRVPMFPGMSPAALIAQLKKRGTGAGEAKEEEPEEDQGRDESQNEEIAPSPSVLSRSPRSASHMAGAARVLPPIGGKEGGSVASPAWLKELKSKKRLSQHEGV